MITLLNPNFRKVYSLDLAGWADMSSSWKRQFPERRHCHVSFLDPKPRSDQVQCCKLFPLQTKLSPSVILHY